MEMLYVVEKLFCKVVFIKKWQGGGIVEKVTTMERYHEMINGSKPVAAVFKANWCKDCHYIEPFMPEIEKAYADELQFIEIDRDELPELCLELNIMGIPSFLIYKEGKELVRFVSKLRKTREEIEQFLDRGIAVAKAL